MASRMDQMQSTIEALGVSLTDVTTEVISLRGGAVESASQIATLTATSKAEWEGLTARADQTESDVTDVQGHVRRGGGPGDGGAREEGAVLAVARGRPRLETIIACIVLATRGDAYTSHPPANEIFF